MKVNRPSRKLGRLTFFRPSYAKKGQVKFGQIAKKGLTPIRRRKYERAN